ncbi:MAG: hypothetical protein ACW991_04795, partial [Candidatus Hodarchaeales archaeon]
MSDQRYCLNCKEITLHRHHPISQDEIILQCVVCEQEEKTVKIKEIPKVSIYPSKNNLQEERKLGREKLSLSEALKRLRHNEKSGTPMTKRSSFFNKADKFWVYSGLFGLSLLLHYLTPYYQYQAEPNFVYSVIWAPFLEELIYRFLGILIAFYCSKSIAESELIVQKIIWGVVFIASVIFEIGLSVWGITNFLTFNPTGLTIIVVSIFLVGLLVFKEYQLEIIIFISSFNFAFVHESVRFFPVFIAGVFFALLCVNRSRITL